jgi:hypothetical protein
MNLDRKTAVPGIDGARRDQAVVGADRTVNLALRDAEAFELRGVDGDFEQLLAGARKIGLQHTGNRFELVAQIARQAQQRPLRHVARQRHGDDGER